MFTINLSNFTKCDVFTPSIISQQMSSFLSLSGTLLEPACGEGHLLTHLDLSKYDCVDLYDIKSEYLDKCPHSPNIHKYCDDFITATFEGKTYDNIIMNPPYIRFQNLHPLYRTMLQERWEILQKGNIDIYYAFILRAIELLSDNGVLVMITPNSYLRNTSAKSLRKYLVEHTLIQEIIDFESKKVFDSVNTYCCITVITKQPKTELLYNDRSIVYDAIQNGNIFGVEHPINTTLQSIAKCRNGLATLRDKVFVHIEKVYDEPCWQKVYCGNCFKWIIYPYDHNGVLLKETIFKTHNPLSYAYLETKNLELANRDKGKKMYEAWYAYGRRQSLIKSNAKHIAYIPILANPENIHIHIDIPYLYKNCISIEVIHPDYTIEQIVEIIQKNKDVLQKQCQKRGSGWIVVKTSILKQLPI